MNCDMLPDRGFPTFPHPLREYPARERFEQERAPNWLSVNLETAIHADARRLFHALADPEYLEAWLCIPGHRPGCSVMASRYDSDYLVEHFCEGRQSLLISGRYQLLRRRRLVFSWRVDGDLTVPPTQVDIRLRGDFENTVVALRHTGFAFRHNCMWHHALWHASMARLASLYGRSD